MQTLPAFVAKVREGCLPSSIGRGFGGVNKFLVG